MVRLGKPELAPGVLEVVRDYRGRLVTLTKERWDHIVTGHPAMDGLEMAVKRAVETADVVSRGNGPGSEVIYGCNLGPARWLAVVVAYEQQSGFIVTAYPQNKDPRAATGTDRPPEGAS